MEGNFQKADPNSYSTMDTWYDYGSIMHYGRTFFSVNGQNTIDTLRAGKYFSSQKGNKIELSPIHSFRSN